jgi:hypothetical protein
VSYFDEDVAARYDETIGRWGDPDVINPAVDFIVGMASGGAALELGIGTGRIALPLAARGVPVHGIDASEAMVARLRAKPGGAEIPVAIGDFATTRVEGVFSVVYLVFNTIMNLTTQDAQVACFENAAAHLHAGGRFVVEVALPQLQRLPPGQTIHPFSYESPTRFGFDDYDIANQGLVSHHYDVRDGAFGPWSIPFRYVWPSELDLMARVAGMRTHERWSGWRRESFTSESSALVGVWEKAD